MSERKHRRLNVTIIRLWLGCLCLAAGLAVGADRPREQEKIDVDVAKQKEGLQGKWAVVSAEFHGRKIADRNPTFEFKDDKFIVSFSGAVEETCSFTIADKKPQRDPFAIDLKH